VQLLLEHAMLAEPVVNAIHHKTLLLLANIPYQHVHNRALLAASANLHATCIQCAKSSAADLTVKQGVLFTAA
jgi:hypothetical protein